MTPIMAKSMQAAVVPAFRQDCTPYDDRNANRCDRWLPEALRRARSDAPRRKEPLSRRCVARPLLFSDGVGS